MDRLLICSILLTVLAFWGCESSNNSEPAAQPPKLSAQARKSDAVYAYVDAAREDLSDGKVQIINKVMRLTPEESKVFWPIYQEYEQELFDLGDQRVEVSRNFVKAQATSSLDNKGAEALADGFFKFENSRLDLLHKYHKRIAEELSPVRAAQFTQIEHRIGTVVDLLIASELPLVKNEKVSK